MTVLWFRGTTVALAAIALGVSAIAGMPAASGATRTSTTIVVTTRLDNTTNDGFCSLREAVQASNTHHAVDTCAAGVGTVTIQLPLGTITLNSRLSVTSSVALAGAGQSLSVIDGGNKTGLLRVASGVKVGLQSLTLAHSSTVAVDNHGTLTMDRVELTGNQASGDSSTGETNIAAAMENYGTATLTGVTVDNNTGEFTGGPVGAVYGAPGSTTTLNDDDFLSNTAYGTGAPIVQIEGTLNATGVQFANNTSNNVDNPASDSAILQSDGAMHASQLVFAQNTGSAALATAGTATASLVSITGNTATGVTNSGTLTLAGASIVGNAASYEVGGIANSGTLTLLQATVSGNSGYGQEAGAGGISNSGTATIANTTIDSNSGSASFDRGPSNVDTAGGLYNSGTATLNNVTLTANHASQDTSTGPATDVAAGIENTPGSTLKIGNSIVAYNVADTANVKVSCQGTLTSTGYNLVQSINTGCTVSGTTTGDKTGDPKLGPLQYNNGFANTRLPLTGSPVIDTGSPATPGSSTPGACRSVDERSVPRPRGPRCDIGATEK